MSLPDLTISPLPISIFSNSPILTPSAFPLGYLIAIGPLLYNVAVYNMFLSSFSSLGAINTIPGISLRYVRSKTP